MAVVQSVGGTGGEKSGAFREMEEVQVSGRGVGGELAEGNEQFF